MQQSSSRGDLWLWGVSFTNARIGTIVGESGLIMLWENIYRTRPTVRHRN